MPLIYLIRHGENNFNRKGKLAGWLPGVHLNDRGKSQARGLVDIFSNIAIQAVYASPLERTIETAEPLAAEKKLEIVPREGIGEIHYGTWQGRSLKYLRKRKLWLNIKYTPSLVRFPEGESFVEAQNRAVAEIEQLRSLHKGRKVAIACFSHADLIKLIIAHYIGLPLDLFQRLTIMPASISVLMFTNSVQLLSLNNTSATQLAAHG
jgi:probable phosphoglycerate mutase